MALFQSSSDHFFHAGLPVAVVRSDRGIACLPHRHDYHEIVFVLRGHGAQMVEGQVREFAAGDVLLVRGGQVHHFRAVHDLARFTLKILPGAAGSLGELFTLDSHHPGCQGHFTPSRREFDRALALLREMEAAFALPVVWDGPRFVLHWHALLIMIARWRADRMLGPSPQRIPQFHSAEHRLRPVVSYLEAHFTADIRLDDLAELSAMSSRSLLRAFQTTTGRPPFVFLHDLRLTQAMIKLRHTSSSVTEVALDSGFNDLSFFNRKFKAHTGLAPSVWRQKPPHEW